MGADKTIQRNKGISINITANFAARIWSMVSIYIFIPLYIYFLGEETFGLIAFFATLQVVMNLLGLGLSKALRRVFASGENTDANKLYKYQMMRSVEIVYSGVAILIIMICFIGAEFIAGSWLNLGALDPNTVTFTIRLMGVSIGLQVLTYMYSGCLFGLEYQVRANIYQMGWSFCKNVGVVLVVWLIASDIKLFFTWFIIADIGYLIILRSTVIGFLHSRMSLSWKISNLSNLQTVWRFAAGLVIISVVYALNTQIDKAVISKYLSLTDLGAYSLAFLLGNVTSIFASAVGTAVFSRFTYLYTTGKYKEKKDYFLLINKSVGISIGTVGAFLSLYSYEIILLWSGSLELANLVKTSAFFVIIGSTFLSLQILPYEFLLARGNTIVNNIQSLCFIPYVLLVTPYLIKEMGLYGAGLAWFIQMVIATILYVMYIHKKFIGNGSIRWLFVDVLLPFATAFGLASLSRQFYLMLSFSLIQTVIFAVCVGGVTLILLYFIYDRRTLKLGVKFIKKFCKKYMKRG